MPSASASRRSPRARGVAPCPEAPAPRRLRARRIVRRLRRLYPDASCTLDAATPFQLLVATILSAQCTDERVNALTPALFRRFPAPRSFASAPLAQIEAAVRPTGFYRNKARAIQEMARALLQQHAGELPRAMEQLTALPGVGRKTANVIRGACFGMPAVIVDTHVQRLAGRLALSAAGDPVGIERDLMDLLPEGDWTFASQALILHGRRVCAARRPHCTACELAADCPAAPGARER